MVNTAESSRLLVKRLEANNNFSLIKSHITPKLIVFVRKTKLNLEHFHNLLSNLFRCSIMLSQDDTTRRD